MSQKNMAYLLNNRIIYRRYPINDVPTDDFGYGWYFEQGTHEYYSLFHSKSVITSHRSLVWHLLVLQYLNPDLNDKQFNNLAYYITDKKNGFISFDIKRSRLDNIILGIKKQDPDRPPKNRLRKVVFRDSCGLTTIEKLRITGKLIGRNKNASDSDIYEIMLYIHEKGEKVTIKKIAESLKVTTRTIYRNMSDILKKEKDLLNEKLQPTKLHQEQT